MSSSAKAPRLCNYSIAAAAALVASGTAASGDVISGSFDFSFGRTAGTRFFNNMTERGNPGNQQANSEFMGDLGFNFYATVAFSTDALFRMNIESNSMAAIFNVRTTYVGTGYTVRMMNWVDAGVSW